MNYPKIFGTVFMAVLAPGRFWMERSLKYEQST